MCLIFKSPGLMLKKELFLNSNQHNSDGWGIMFAGDGRVNVYKMMGTGEAQWRAYYEMMKEGKVPHVSHHRFATHGNKSIKMVHPFKILDKDKHGIDLYMMHNGVLSGVELSQKGNSDTWHFVKDYLKPILKKNPALIHNAGFKKMLDRAIGGGNKLVFLDSNGISTIINREAGETSKDGFWFSNKYSLEGRFRFSTPANQTSTGDDDWGNGTGYYTGGNRRVYGSTGGRRGYWEGNVFHPYPENTSAASRTAGASSSNVCNLPAITKPADDLAGSTPATPLDGVKKVDGDNESSQDNIEDHTPVSEPHQQGSVQEASTPAAVPEARSVHLSPSKPVSSASTTLAVIDAEFEEHGENKKKDDQTQPSRGSAPSSAFSIKRRFGIVRELACFSIQSLEEFETFQHFHARLNMLEWDDINDLIVECPDLMTHYFWLRRLRSST